MTAQSAPRKRGRFASPELEQFVLQTARPHYVTDAGIDTYCGLIKWCQTEGRFESVPMPVYPYAPDSPFSERADHAFQAWHDQLHCTLKAPFDLLGEYDVAAAQCEAARAAGLSLPDCQFIWYFVFGRNLYVYRHNDQGPTHRAEFVEACFQFGMTEACKGNYGDQYTQDWP